MTASAPRAGLPRGATPLARSFYRRPSPEVARALLGRLFIRRQGGRLLVGRIVECEAYQQDDEASHSYRGLTPANRAMFGPPGHLYVYFTYGMHFCINVVTGRDGEGSAVLLRAVEPLQGLEVMRARRGVDDVRLLCSGPARLTQAYGVTRTDDGADLVVGRRSWVGRGRPVDEGAVAVGPRVGITRAAERPWRFVEAGSRFVSRARRARSGSDQLLGDGDADGTATTMITVSPG